MKKVLLCSVFICSVLTVLSQAIPRIEVKGKIVVESSDIEDVSVYNKSSDKGTVTNENGEFTIAVALNDRVEFSALQFNDFAITIDERIMDSKQMTVFLVEKINKLDEVIVLPRGLTGNLELDVENVKTINVDMNALCFGVLYCSDYDFSEDYRTNVENTLMHSQGQTMVDGLNVINLMGVLLKPMFKTKRLNEKKTQPDIPGGILKSQYDIEFLNQNFNIPKHKIEDFVHFVKADGLDDTLFETGKELQFLEFLYQQSKLFLAKQIEKD